MAYEKREGSGSLFKNDRKEQPNHPDYKGDILIDGQEYWLSAWIKEGKSGKFMSLAAKPKEARQEQAATKPKLPGNIQDMDDSIPFANPYKGIKSYVI
jgi:hypothetical protein